jgi:hypothetical protein
MHRIHTSAYEPLVTFVKTFSSTSFIEVNGWKKDILNCTYPLWPYSFKLTYIKQNHNKDTERSFVSLYVCLIPETYETVLTKFVPECTNYNLSGEINFGPHQWKNKSHEFEILYDRFSYLRKLTQYLKKRCHTSGSWSF